MEREYLEYVGFFSLSILAAAAAYFIDLDQPLTWIALILVPISFGYSAYTSDESFRKGSLASLMTLFLVGTGPIVSAVAIIVAFGNPLISVFAGGNTFRDFFSSVTLPMLIVGLILGGAVYGEMQINPDSQEQLRNFTAKAVSNQTETAVNQMEIAEEFKSAQKETVRQASRASVERTSAIVSSNMSQKLNQSQVETLADSLQYARENVPDELADTASTSKNATELPVSDSVSNLVEEKMNGKALLLVIPIIGLSLYSLNPFIGLLTGLFGVLFRYLSEKF